MKFYSHFLIAFVTILALFNNVNCHNTIPTKHTLSTADVTSHSTMKKWIDTHKFSFKFPKWMNRFFSAKLVRDPSNFILPPGQLWPYPAEFWTMKPSGWFSSLWSIYVKITGFTEYTPHLFLYRLTNSGIGHMPDINPGAYIQYETDMIKNKANKPNSPEWRLSAFHTAVSLFHTAENDAKLIDILLELCHETTLTPNKCDTPEAKDPWKSMIRNLLMSSYLRLGENENCRENHSHESCLLPLKGKAVHLKPFGSTLALKYFEIELQAIPENIGAKWLLNVAHMTLGTYPNGVPSQWLIEPSIFESEYDIKKFTNVEEILGIDTFTSMGTGIVDDFLGNDNLKDIFQCSASYNKNVKLYKNLGTGKFEDVTEAAGLKGIDGGANCRQADYNNDGHLDIFIMRGGWLKIDHVNGLLRNNGDGTFTDVAFKMGLKTTGATHTMDYADINRDGKLDFFVANEDFPCEMWLNLGDDNIINVADGNIVDCGLVKGMVFTDYNDDMWPDIMLSRYAGKNRLLRNDGKYSDTEKGKWSFTDVTDEVGLGDPWFSFPTTTLDIDQDGSLDILVAGHLFEGPDAVAWIYTNESYFINTLHNEENPNFGSSPSQKLTRAFLNKNGKFEEIGEEGGLRRHIMTMAMNYGDLDNDGMQDLYFGTGQPDVRALQPNRMYRNNFESGTNFQDVTTSGNFGHIQKGHGIAFVDIDNDGDHDVYGQMGGAFAGDFFKDAIYLNPGHGNGFIKIDLEGVETNRNGLGSRIYVHTIDENNNKRVLHHYKNTGGSYGSNPMETHIGIGQAVSIEKIIVWWQKTGLKQELVNIPLNSRVKITEGYDGYEDVPLNTYLIDINKIGQEEVHSCH
jgi:hypothetical protein